MPSLPAACQPVLLRDVAYTSLSAGVSYVRLTPPDALTPDEPALVLLAWAPGGTAASHVTLSEAFVLSHTITLADDTRCGPGDYVAAAEGDSLAAVAADPSAGALLLGAMRSSAPLASTTSAPPALLRRRVARPPWGYLDQRNGTDRLPLRYNRQRGDATWLLAWPAGYSAAPTRATEVCLDVFLLQGELCLTPDEPPLQTGQYGFVPQALVPQPWSTAAGCCALLRSHTCSDQSPA